MEAQYNDRQSKKKYAIITTAVRMAFIERVQSKQSTIKQAAQEFGIKFSTSKAILQTFKKEGRVGKKKIRSKRNCIKDESNLKKENEKQNNCDDQQTFLKSQPINLIQMPLQQQQAQQFQILEQIMNVNPYVLQQQNYQLQQSLMQVHSQNLLNYQTWQIYNYNNQVKWFEKI